MQKETSTKKIEQLIQERRTIHQFKPEPVPDEAVIKAAIDNARWAPNHYLTQPWHFYLLGPETARGIAELNAELVKKKNGEKAAKIKLERWLTIPGWLVLTCTKSNDQIRYQEDFAACCCAAQNMILYLWNEGIGVKWTTGDVIRDPRFFKLIHVGSDQETIVGIFWYGYADKIPEVSRKPIDQILTELP